MSPISGEGRFGAVVSATGRHGDERSDWLRSGCLELVSFTLGPMCASTPPTQGRSPVRESRTPGSVRGAPGNGRPYRDSSEEIKVDKAAGVDKAESGRIGEARKVERDRRNETDRRLDEREE